VDRRDETVLLDDHADEQPGRADRRGGGPGRSLSPITIALVIGGILAITGLAMAVITPLAGGSPTAQALPAGSAVAAAPADTGTPTTGPTSTGPSTQASVNPLPSTGPTGRFRPDQLESDVIRLVNQARNQARCKDVHNSSKLHSIARAHSADMAAKAYLGSTGSDGSSYADRARKVKYDQPLGENVAHGPTTAQAVMQGWLGNTGARNRILNCDATDIGVGVAQAADGSYYWTQDFGK
jgi:uncharacterized protein YkwD